MPLSQVEGRIDTVIPCDYDKVLVRVLQNRTDVQIARHGIDRRYQLKLAQMTPLPDVDVNVSILQDFAIAPKQMVPTATINAVLSDLGSK